MRTVISIILSAFLLFSCSDTNKNSNSANNSREVPGPDRAERSRYEALQRLHSLGCLFLSPDTSVLGLKIRDVKSGNAFIKSDKPNSQEQYRYYSKSFQQLLTLIQYPHKRKESFYR